MSNRRRTYRRGAAAMATGMLLVNPSNCLPKDFFYNLAGDGRTVLLETAATVLFDSVVEAIFPGQTDMNGDDNGGDDTDVTL